MSRRLTSFRAAVSAIAVLTLTIAAFAVSRTAAASSWTDVLNLLPFATSDASIVNGWATAQPAAAFDQAIGGPSVSNVTSSNTDRVYGPGESIAIDVLFNSSVTVGSGTPTLALNNGQTATYTTGSGTNTLSFSYPIQVGDTSVADLDYASTTALTADISTPNSSLTLPDPGTTGSLGFNKNIGVNAGLPGACDAFGNLELNADTGTSTGSYATLKAAFDAINAGTHQGVITIDVCGDTTEAAVAAAPSMILNASGVSAALYTSIVMSPAGGAARTISGTSTAGFPMIDFVGSDQVIIDGLNTGGNSLTISNTTVSATSGTGTIRFTTDATSNTITNASILGSATMAVGTNGGNISFTSAAIATGQDNNTVSNCNLGPAGANLPSKVLHFSGSSNTDPGTANSGIIINNNNIFDYFSATVSTAGIDLNSGTVGTTISNNRFYQTATRTMTTTSLTHSAIRISNTSGNAYQITGNTIGFAAANGTGTYTIVTTATSPIIPINLSVGTTTATSVQNNTIAGMAISGASSGTSSSGAFRGIYVGSGLTTVGNVTGNTIGSQSATGSITFTSSSTSASDVMGIFNFGSSNWTVSNNNIGGITASNSSTGAANVYGIRLNTSSTATTTISTNLVGGTVANSLQSTAAAATAGTQVAGIFVSTSIATLTSNIVRNLTAPGGTGTTTSASVVGIVFASATPVNNASQNTIFNLSNTNATAASHVTGIQFTGGTGNVVDRNLIHSLTSATNSASSLAEINGIRVGGGTTTYRNNMIAIGAGTANAIGMVASNAATSGVNGINEALGTNSFFHNSVYIGGAPTAGTGASYAFNGTQVTVVRSFRDNIFFNARSNGGTATGKNYSVKINGTTTNPTGLTINNNVYFANGSGGVFGFFNSLDVANLAAWKTAVGQDAASFESNPQYNDPTNATPDLHIHPTNPTIVEGNGADVGVTDDFDGQTRASFTPVDIGADAGNFMSTGDLGAPIITYTNLANTTSTANRMLSVSVTDAGSGVPTSGIGLPRLYYRKGTTDPYVSTPCVSTAGSNYDCTFDYSMVTGGTVAAGDTIQYFVAAQDLASTPNVAVNPSGGASGLTANPPAASTPPTPPNGYSIAFSVTGTYTVDGVGGGGNFASLTNAAGIFEFINNNVVSGNVTINISANLASELGTVALNEFPSPHTLTIRPSGNPRTITGTNSGALIRLNGADRVTIDGNDPADDVVGGDPTLRQMTITNTNIGTSSAVIGLISLGAGAGATNNTIKNTNIRGNTPTTTLFGIFAGGSTLSITGTTAAGADNDNNTYQNNSIGKVQYGIYSVGAGAGNKNTGTVITQNALNLSSPDNVDRGGIAIAFDDGAQITENSVAATSTTGVDVFGISVGHQPNTFSLTGFTVNETTNASVARNKVGPVSTTALFAAVGVAVGFAPSGTNSVINNMVSGVTSPATTPDFVGGIYVNGTSPLGTTNVHFNSVYLSGDRGSTASQYPSFAIAIGGSADPFVSLLDNIFVNAQTQTGTGSTGRSYAIGHGGPPPYTNFVSNYNDMFVSGAQATLGITGGLVNTAAGMAQHADLAAWQTATARDANSQSVDPLFVSTSDLHLQAMSPVIDDGIAIGGITLDFDRQARNQGAAPDIGADETVPAAAGTIQFSSATYMVGEGGGMVTLTVTRTGGSAGAVTVNYSLGGGTATGGATCGGSVDYDNDGGSVMFADGDAANKTFDVPICDDSTYENPDETFDATLSIGSGGATIGTPNPATVTINDNDTQPTVQFSMAAYTTVETLTKSSGVPVPPPGATITVTRSGALGNTVSVNYGVNAGGTATGGAMCGAPGVDYVTPSGTLTFNPTETTKMFFVETCFDMDFEGDETVNLGLSMVTGGGTLGMPATAVLTITDNDLPVITLDSSSYIQDESQTMVVTVQRSGTGSGTSSVLFTTGGGNATGGTCIGAADYESQNVTVTFTGTQTSQTVNIPICADMINEFPETFNITLSSPMNATLGSPSMAVATINEAATQFQNMTPIAITDGAVTSSVINVSGATTSIYYVRVTLFDISDDVADDLNFLLVGPGGENFVLMADAGGTGAIGPETTITFNDNSALFVPDASTIASGSYKPSSWEIPASVFPAPAPAGPYTEPGPGGSRSAFMNTTFGGLNANGEWTLYVYDDNGGSFKQLAPGTIAGGWGIELIGPTAAGVSLSGRVTDAGGRGIRNATVTIEGGGLTEPRIVATGSMGYYNVEDLAIGTYIVTVHAKRHSFANPTRSLSMSDNVADFDFVAEP